MHRAASTPQGAEASAQVGLCLDELDQLGLNARLNDQAPSSEVRPMKTLQLAAGGHLHMAAGRHGTTRPGRLASLEAGPFEPSFGRVLQTLLGTAVRLPRSTDAGDMP